MTIWLILLSLFSFSLADQSLLSKGYVLDKTPMGDVRYSMLHSNVEKHSVVYLKDYNTLSTQLIERLTQRIISGESYELKTPAMNCQWGQGPDYFRFLPEFKGAAFVGQGAVSYANHCFQQNQAQITNTTDTSITITITVGQAADFDCYDTYLIALLDQYHVEKIEFHGKHVITFSNLNPDDLYDITQNGVRLFVFCDDYETLVVDLSMTIELFAGGFTTHK